MSDLELNQYQRINERQADEIERLRTALGMCKSNANGKHLWTIFPIDTQGRMIHGPITGYTGAGCFCQHCLIPKSPYHDDANEQTTTENEK